MGRMTELYAESAEADNWYNLYFDMAEKFEWDKTVTWKDHIPRMELMLAKHIKNKKLDDSISRDYIWMKLLDILEKNINKGNRKYNNSIYENAAESYSGGIEWWKD